MPVLGHVVLTEVGATAEASHSGRTLSGLPERLQASEIQIADGFYLVALTDEEYEPVMLFLNHSCEPNVGFAGNSVLVAMCDVAPGEELTTDYALFDTSSDEMACRCGQLSCRGQITGADWKLPELQAKYAGYLGLRARRAWGASSISSEWSDRRLTPHGRGK